MTHLTSTDFREKTKDRPCIKPHHQAVVQSSDLESRYGITMENEQHVKSLNTDARGKNRLRFSSTRKRSKTASADVYRSYKRRIGVTSAASREERVHHPYQDENYSKKKRQRLSSGDDRIAELGRTEESSDDEIDNESTFASELDLAHDRNASEIFGEFHREIWHLVRSLPEVLHHASQIIDISMSYMLSPESNPSEKSPAPVSSGDRVTYVTNHATTDIFHLLAVLARDLRHEIHPYVHSRIVPRIVYDLLNPPAPPPESGRQPLPMSVTVVEAAFRTLSYVFRYDSEPILSEVDKEGQEACLEKMRQYYGATLGHKRDYLRRLAAESFAPMVRKLKTDNARRKHIRRVLRALAASAQCSDDELIPHSLRRAQSDAVDGVSFLLFETARGMSGRLHSKGHQIIGCVLDCLTGGSTKGGIEMIHLVTCALVGKICDHLEKEHFAVVWNEMFRAATKTLSDMESFVGDESSPSALSCVLELIDQIVSFKSGIYIRKPDKNGGLDRHAECVKALVRLLRKLLDPAMFCRLLPLSQRLVLKVLCSSWRALPDNPVFAAQLSPLFPAILSIETVESVDLGSDDQGILNPAVILARDLLPFLPCDVVMKLVGRAILAAAAKQARDNPVRSLMLIFSVISVRSSSDTSGADIDDDDNIFSLENTSHCSISSVDKKALVNLCLLDTSWKKCDADADTLARLGVSARCLPFLFLAGNAKDDSNNECAPLLKKIWKWSLGSLKALGEEIEKASTEKGKSPSVDDFVVTKSLVLESCARMAIACFDDDVVDTSAVKKYLLQMRPYAEGFLLSHSHSIWAIKSVAAFVDALGNCGIGLSDSPNEVFEALIPNLRQKSHFLRLHILEILASFPKRPYITDHAEIDWTDDLDEEPSVPSEATPKVPSGSNLPTGLCDMIDNLLKLESTPINFRNERLVVSCITRVEVLGRTGRLPVLYGEAASNHMLGILHVKFSPIWSAATKALISLASGHEACVWQPLAERIKEITTSAGATDIANELESDPIVTPIDHHSRCSAWETSNGSDPVLFRDQVIAAHADGRVSRHLTTDEPTIFGLVWSVLEGAPELTAKKSRVIVPIFLEFLHSQYFVYHDNDPDARELLLQDEIEDTKM
jgi:U3 small nucleolar RNA-associated protein 20